MVAAVVVLRQRSLAVDGPAELAAPDHQRLVEQTALFQVLDEGGGGLVDVLALAADLRRQAAVLVPAAVHELDEPHAALDHPPGEQAVAGEAAVDRAVSSRPYMSQDRLRLARQVGQLGDRRSASGRPSRTGRSGC